LLIYANDCWAQSCGVWPFSDEIFSVLNTQKIKGGADSFSVLDIAKETMYIDGRSVALSFSVIPNHTIDKLGKSV